VKKIFPLLVLTLVLRVYWDNCALGSGAPCVQEVLHGVVVSAVGNSASGNPMLLVRIDEDSGPKHSHVGKYNGDINDFFVLPLEDVIRSEWVDSK
jgi:hypothetical protein